MTNDSELSEIGAGLVEWSKEEMTSARGLVEELFPYIAAASRRMSSRSISRYLQERHGVKLSAATIAKALRNPARYWEPFTDRAEAAARIFGDAHDVTIRTVLTQPEVIFACQTDPPKLSGAGASDETFVAVIDEYKDAANFLAHTWAQMDETVRAMALDHIEFDDDDESGANQ